MATHNWPHHQARPEHATAVTEHGTNATSPAAWTVNVYRVGELTADMWAGWETVVDRLEPAASPYFFPEFTRAVAGVRDDVRVVVVRTECNSATSLSTRSSDASASGPRVRPVAFWPIQRARRGVGEPVGGPLNDFHGVVAAEPLPGDAAWILGHAGLKSWRFHHLAGDQPWFWPARASQSASPRIDLRNGFECYARERHRQHRRTFHDLQRRARQLAQHRGTLRFEFDVRDRCLLDRLVAWKRDQYQRTAVVDVFGFAWTRELVERLHAHRTPRFAGVLSALYAGDDPVALHFGLRTERVLHCWFPAYDTSVARWSPGLQLFLRLIEAAAHAGLERVDFGKGREGFKRKLANAETVVAEGVAGESRARRQLRRQWHWAREKLQTSRLHGRLQRPLRWAARVVHPQRGAAAFQLPPAHPRHANPTAGESIPGSF